MADERRSVALSADDHVAALQILAFLANPSKPERALQTLRDWARHLINQREGKRTWSAEKASRLDPKIARVDRLVERRLRGAYWLRLKLNEAAGPGHGRSIRASASRSASRDAKIENTIRDMWDETRPVAHLALATGDAIMLADAPEQRLARRWNLARVAFRPDWVRRAIADAEIIASHADRFGVITIDKLILFHRDNF